MSHNYYGSNFVRLSNIANLVLDVVCLDDILMLMSVFFVLQTAVQQLFHPDQSHSSIKEQVCEVVQLIATTIHQIHAVFYQINKKQQEQSPGKIPGIM